MNKNYIFKKRVLEPDRMTKLEEKAFHDFMLKNYKRLYFPLVDLIFNKVKIKKGNIVDFGCGTGLLAKAIFSFNKNLSITGIDYSESMLKKARSICRGTNILFKKENVTKTKFPNNYVDIIVSKDSFHEFPEPKKIIKEMLRVIKPKGFIFIFDLRRDMPLKYIKMAWPRKTLMQKIQYNSAAASYTSKELSDIIKIHKPTWYSITTRKLTKTIKNKYNNIPTVLLKQGFQTRYLVIIKK